MKTSSLLLLQREKTTGYAGETKKLQLQEKYLQC